MLQHDEFMRYRRTKVAGGTYSFTVNLADRSRRLLTEHIDLLRNSVKRVKYRHPFESVAWVVLPEHLHAVWTLPPGDADYSTRWLLIKAAFSAASHGKTMCRRRPCAKASAASGNTGSGSTSCATKTTCIATSITCTSIPSSTGTQNEPVFGRIRRSIDIFDRASWRRIGQARAMTGREMMSGFAGSPRPT